MRKLLLPVMVLLLLVAAGAHTQQGQSRSVHQLAPGVFTRLADRDARQPANTTATTAAANARRRVGTPRPFMPLSFLDGAPRYGARSSLACSTSRLIGKEAPAASPPDIAASTPAWRASDEAS